MQKGFWMPRDDACLTDGDMNYDNSSRSEPKRGHDWFTDAAAPDLFSNKKQAIESVDNRPVSGIADINVSPWHTGSFQSVSGQFSDRLFGSEPMQTVNLVDRNISSIDSGNMNMGRKDFEDQYVNSSSMGLSISQTGEDASCLNFGGIRKVKVNQVKDSTNGMPASMGQPYSRGVNGLVSMSTAYSTSCNNAISLDLPYGSGEENTISMGPTFTKEDGNFIAMGHTFNKRAGDFISMGHNYNKGNESILSVGLPFDKEDGNFISMGQSYGKGDANLTSLSPSYGKGQGNFISSAYGQPNANLISMVPSFDKEDDNIPMQPSYHKAGCNITAMAPTQDKGESSILSMHQNYNKGESNTISFGSFNDEPETNPSGNIISGYDLLMNNQSSVQASEVPSQKSLKGYIQGTGYMCGCKDCNFKKALNAYEFEHHANCKTKHPNNHIYFENGKTIYAVVQELKNTPQERLFDVIQNVTGSQINQKNFRIWKASYQAATRELQRIYGKDNAVVSS
ncbi:hypothetical protein ES319_A13G022500v1 [Gossypium barbadense]|uniref:Tify domain-containing protein n=1 Tax=Gossypium barbadense TaxID=3634 RepID=A0A5J5SXJ2_GOSBA|nr:hypothetical protein ES319_A13G022500v1 [Gossypium barbadense]